MAPLRTKRLNYIYIFSSSSNVAIPEFPVVLVRLKPQCEVRGLILAEFDGPFDPVDGVGQQMLRFAHTGVCIRCYRKFVSRIFVWVKLLASGSFDRLPVYIYIIRVVVIEKLAW